MGGASAPGPSPIVQQMDQSRKETRHESIHQVQQGHAEDADALAAVANAAGHCKCCHAIILPAARRSAGRVRNDTSQHDVDDFIDCSIWLHSDWGPNHLPGRIISLP